MYANQGYQPPHSRGFSFGAALAINAAIIAGLIYSAPNIIPSVPHIFEGKSIPLDKTPPPPPKPEPKIERRVASQTPRPTAPDTVVPTKSENTTETDPIIYPPQPPLRPAPTGDPIVTPEPVVLPPLLGAAQDPRYLKDFQPEYPSSELRAQRDGQVRVRVLIGVDGRVKEVQQLDATSTAFFEVTKRQALGKWRFKPASRGGVPEESWKVMNVRFELENAR